jgi:hypothetical protein
MPGTERVLSRRYGGRAGLASSRLAAYRRIDEGGSAALDAGAARPIRLVEAI